MNRPFDHLIKNEGAGPRVIFLTISSIWINLGRNNK